MTKHSKLLSLAACIGTLFAVAPASALVTITCHVHSMAM